MKHLECGGDDEGPWASLIGSKGGICCSWYRFDPAPVLLPCPVSWVPKQSQAQPDHFVCWSRIGYASAGRELHWRENYFTRCRRLRWPRRRREPFNAELPIPEQVQRQWSICAVYMYSGNKKRVPFYPITILFPLTCVILCLWPFRDYYSYREVRPPSCRRDTELRGVTSYNTVVRRAPAPWKHRNKVVYAYRCCVSMMLTSYLVLSTSQLLKITAHSLPATKLTQRISKRNVDS